jgi:hypothetical protein
METFIGIALGLATIRSGLQLLNEPHIGTIYPTYLPDLAFPTARSKSESRASGSHLNIALALAASL